MVNFLEKIVAHKRKELPLSKNAVSEQGLLEQIEAAADIPRGFMKRMEARNRSARAAVIAEIKRASPSRGIIRKDFDVAPIAVSYRDNGAICLSVLTDRSFFHGDPTHLQTARQAVDLPVLRKDFMIDPYQIIESRALGADCVLLIATILSDLEMSELVTLAHDLGMDVLVEVHDQREFEQALSLPVRAIGVNNRDLRDFSISMDHSLALKQQLPEDYFLISESGFAKYEDIVAMQRVGINSFLIGGALMQAPDPGAALASLIYGTGESYD